MSQVLSSFMKRLRQIAVFYFFARCVFAKGTPLSDYFVIKVICLPESINHRHILVHRYSTDVIKVADLSSPLK